MNDWLKDALATLGISQVEAAHLLSVDARTVRRWMEAPERMPGLAEQAVLAWLNLHRWGLPWKPGSEDIVGNDVEQIALHRQHALDLNSLLKKVEERGGPATKWTVNLKRNTAHSNEIEITFHRLKNGSFSPSSYRRKDKDNNLQDDWNIIEDGFYCIAEAIKRMDSKNAQKLLKSSAP